MADLDPAPRVVMLTTFGRSGYFQSAVRAGAVSYMLKDAPAEHLASNTGYEPMVRTMFAEGLTEMLDGLSRQLVWPRDILVEFRDCVMVRQRTCDDGKEWQDHASPAASDPQLAAMPAQANPLTSREREVLRLVGHGCGNAEIASRVHLSHGTVRNYISEAMSKLYARNRTAAARIAREKGWL